MKKRKYESKKIKYLLRLCSFWGDFYKYLQGGNKQEKVEIHWNHKIFAPAAGCLIYVLFLPENLIKCVTLFGPLYDRIFRALRARVFFSPENRSNISSFFFSQIFRFGGLPTGWDVLLSTWYTGLDPLLLLKHWSRFRVCDWVSLSYFFNTRCRSVF